MHTPGFQICNNNYAWVQSSCLVRCELVVHHNHARRRQLRLRSRPSQNHHPHIVARMPARASTKHRHGAENHSPVPAATALLVQQREHSSATQRPVRNAVRYMLENRQLTNIDEAIRKASRITDREDHATRTLTAQPEVSCHVSQSSASSKLVAQGV